MRVCFSWIEVTRRLIPTGLLRACQEVKEKPEFRADDI